MSEGGPARAGAFVRLLILTAAREMETADMATGEVRLPAAVWRIPSERTKNGNALVLPLSPPALAEVRAVWPAHDAEAGKDWRLLGSIKGSRVRGFSNLSHTTPTLKRASSNCAGLGSATRLRSVD